jgi:GrpB-like predicted nucleotidyltransferase (UPF0157 family)
MKINDTGNGQIELAPYDASWPQKATEELGRLRSVLGENLARGEHIGSTAIPDIAAKPIIDLLPVVRSLSRLDESRPELEALGYEWRGEFGIPGRRLCLRDCASSGRRLANVHFFESGSPEIVRHVAFRDYLLAHPSERIEYEAVKRRAAELFPMNVHEYNDAKSDWIKSCERRALDWVESFRSVGFSPRAQR